jgi:hypothetical protein
MGFESNMEVTDEPQQGKRKRVVTVSDLQPITEDSLIQVTPGL